MTLSPVLDVLPQKPPFLMVDRILDMIPGKQAVGIKALGLNEPYFIGHFPGNPIMPGVLQIEAMNQVGAYVLSEDPKFTGKLAIFAGCNNVKFKRPAVPGDVLIITTEIFDSESRIGSGRGKIEIDGKLISEADLTFFIQG